jgi:5'-nucleotidase / UDP-sugar diphosphatase
VLATTLTGTQVKEVLEQGASGQHGRVQVSGLRFTYDPSQPVGSRVTSITASATGQPVDPGANYRVVTNDFMINGGDNYTTFQRGTNPVIYSDHLLSDVLVGYVRQFSPINQQIEGRISPQ